MTERQRNRRGEGQRLREEIVRAATELIEEHGSEDAVTLRAVARRVGIAAPSIYAHFDGRGAILHAVLETTFAELADVLERDAGRADDPRDRLHALATSYLDFAEARAGRYAVLFGRTRRDPTAEMTERRDVGQLAGARAFDVLLDAVRDVRPDDADVLLDATLFWSTLHGVAVLMTTVPAFPWPERAATVAALVERTADGRLTR